MPKIRSGWEQHGHGLRLYDSAEPFDHTMLEMQWAPGADTVDKTSEETSEETSSRVSALLRQSPNLSARQLAALLGLSQRSVALQLAKLKSAHRLKRYGPNKGGRWEVLP